MKISDRASKSPASGIRYMFELAKEYPDVVNLCIGEPGFSTPEHIILAACEALKEGYTKYTSNAGIFELRAVLAEKLYNDNGIVADPAKNIIVTTGAGEAIMLSLLVLVNPGDEVIIPDPCWPNYYGHIRVAQGIPVPVRTSEKNAFSLTAEAVAQALTEKTKVIIVNSPSNPTGAIVGEKNLREIGALAKKHHVMILSDEPYEKLIYDNCCNFSLGSVETLRDHVITVNSFSKTYAMTGWRVGYAAGPKFVIEPMVKLQENLSSCVNSAAQRAGIAALKGPQNDVWQMIEEYRRRRDVLIEGVRKIPGFSIVPPRGAFYAFVNIKDWGMTSVQVAEKLLKEVQVATTPGSAFGDAGEG